MRKFYWILGLVVLTFFGDRLGGELLENLLLKSQFRYSRLYRGEAKADILLVGNSRGLSFYQPFMEEMTGLTTFNLSYSAMPMNLAEVLVDDYLEKYPAPKFMVVDVTLCDRTNAELIAGFNCYSHFSPNLDSLIYQTSASVNIGGKVSHLFRYNGEIFQRSLYYLHKLDEDWLLDREISNRLMDDIRSVDSASVKLVPEMVDCLKRTIEKARQHGVEVKLVVSPYYLPFAQKIFNLDAMIAEVKAATGLGVYDYSRALDKPEDFGDYQHINIKGSRSYIAMLKKDGVLP